MCPQPAPALRTRHPARFVKLDKDASTTISVADYVTDPAGKSVRLTTTDKISAAPAGRCRRRPAMSTS